MAGFCLKTEDYATEVKSARISLPRTQELVLEPLEVEVVIEISRGSFLKRGSTGRIDFISPLPCPFKYGSVPTHLGLEGDLLAAVVLGPRLPVGTRLRFKAWGAVTLTDPGMSDDKLICSVKPLPPPELQIVLRKKCRAQFSVAVKDSLGLQSNEPVRLQIPLSNLNWS